MVHRPTFPASEVERLRDERLNDLLQARGRPAPARRRGVHRNDLHVRLALSPAGGRHAGDRREARSAAWLRAALPARPRSGPGDVHRDRRPGRAGRAGACRATSSGRGRRRQRRSRPGRSWPIGGDGTRSSGSIHRPGSVQTELRIGHVGVAAAARRLPRPVGRRRDPRRPVQLAAEHEAARGEGLHVRRRRGLGPAAGAGPFGARAAVNTEVTVPAILDMLTELRRIRDEPVTDAELRAARDFLVGVFPIRFETPGAVLGALAGLLVHELPDDELARYRERSRRSRSHDVQRVAKRAHRPRSPRDRARRRRRCVRRRARGGRSRDDDRRARPRAGRSGREEGVAEAAGPVDSETRCAAAGRRRGPTTTLGEEPDDGRPA